MMLALYLFLPFSLFRILKKTRQTKAFNNKDYKLKFGVLTKDLRVRTKTHLAY